MASRWAWPAIGLLAMSLLVSCQTPAPTPASCVPISEFSLCAPILNYSMVQAQDGCQDDLEFYINNTAFIWGTVSPKCRQELSLYMCLDKYSTCDQQPICRSVCESVQDACKGGADSLRLASLDPQMGYLYRSSCTSLPETDCVGGEEEIALAERDPLPIAECQTYSGDFCAPWINYDVYVPHGKTQHWLENQARAVMGILGLVNRDCANAMGAWACNQAFMKCNQGYVATAFQVDDSMVEYEPAYPSFPCRSTCTEYVDKCASYIAQDPRLEADCNSVGFLAGGHQCGKASFLADWPVKESVMGVILNDAIVTQCNPNEFSNMSGFYFPVVCTKPFIAAGEGIGLIRRYFGPEAQCEMPCPASFLFADDSWTALTNVMLLSIVSFIVNTFLLVTQYIFPKRRKVKYVLRFFFAQWMLSLVVMFGFAAIPTWSEWDLRFINCQDATTAWPMGFNYCTFQAVSLFWLTLVTVGWWLVIGLDLYLTVVKEQKTTRQLKRKKDMIYSICCWGIPSFLLFVFLACGGKLGGDPESTLDFCFLGNRTLREVGEWLDYTTYWLPLFVANCCNVYFVVCVTWKIMIVSRGANSVTTGKSGASKRPYVRLLLFVGMYVFIFMWLVIYRVGFSFLRPLAEKQGLEWARCHIANPGNNELCGKTPSIQIDPVIQFGMHIVVACQGLSQFLAWGTDPSVYRDWKELLMNKGILKDSRASSRTNTTIPNSRVELVSVGSASVGSASAATTGTNMSSSTMMSSTQLASSASSSHLTSSATLSTMPVTGGATDEKDNVHLRGEGQQQRVAMNNARAGIRTWHWWNHRRKIVYKIKARPWQVLLVVALIILFFLVLFLALLTDEGQGTDGFPSQTLPDVLSTTDDGFNIKVIAMDFDYMIVTPVDFNTVSARCKVVVTNSNPCGKYCPVDLEQFSFTLEMLYLNVSIGHLSSTQNVSILPNDDETTDPIRVAFEFDAFLNLTIEDGEAKGLVNYIADTLNKEFLVMQFRGSGSAAAFGIELSGIDIKLDSQVRGGAGFSAETHDMDLPADHPDGGLAIELDLNLHNPGISGMTNLGDIAWDIVKDGTTLGRVFIANNTFLPGNNLLFAEGYMRPGSPAEVVKLEEILSTYLSGGAANLTTVAVLDDPFTQPVAGGGSWVEFALARITIPVPLTGKSVSPLSNTVVSNLQLDFSQGNDVVGSMDTDADMELPFGFPMHLQTIDLTFAIEERAVITVLNASFGEDCECQPPTCVCAFADEDDKLEFQCPRAGDVVAQVYAASLGPGSGPCPPTSAEAALDTNCTEDWRGQITTACLGQPNCTLWANATMPLPNTTTCTSRGLSFNVQCAPVGVFPSTDVTPALSGACDDSPSCTVSLHPDALGGDPAVGCPKLLEVWFRCDTVEGQTGEFVSTAYDEDDLADGRYEDVSLRCRGPAIASTSAVGAVIDLPVVDGSARLQGIHLADLRFTVLPEQKTRFGDYITDLVQSTANNGLISKQLWGHADAVVNTSIGVINVRGLLLDTDLQITGMQGLSTVLERMDVTGGFFATTNPPLAQSLGLRTFSNITNAADIHSKLGAVGFTITLDDVEMGYVVHPDLELFPQVVNVVEMDGIFVESLPQSRTLLENYVLTKRGSTAIKLLGRPESVANEFLKVAFSGLTLSALIPGLAKDLIYKAYVWENDNYPFPPYNLPARFVVYNPFSVPFQITAMDVTLRKANGGSKLGTLDNIVGTPIIIAPGAYTLTPTKYVAGEVNWDSLVFLMSGTVYLDVLGTLSIKIGDFETELDFDQEDVRTLKDKDCIEIPQPTEAQCDQDPDL